ncbi:MAG: DUF373 family protein [Candidatus Micrarchaeota archaeon]|nr:DUF373 family protein [Candidatus Micrarchaeota archaeon]
MEKSKKKLIICVDIDNDLYEKAKIVGPLIGRKANLEGAVQLALADPEEVDSNVIFYGIKIYDELSESEEVEIVTLTGDKRLGITANMIITEQLEKIIQQYKPQSCIFISDGRADEEILPIVKSRVKIDVVKIVVMKQAKELEKTYFVLLEKLRDPYYSRIVLGIPALLILLYSLAAVFSIKLEYIAILFSLYLIGKTLGLEDYVISIFRELKVDFHRLSSFPIFLSILIILGIIIVGIDNYLQSSSILSALKSLSYLPFALIFLYIGKIIDSVEAKNKLDLLKFSRFFVSIMIIWTIMISVIYWLLNEKGIEIVVDNIIQMFGLSIVSFYSFAFIKNRVIESMDLENKEVIGTISGYIGKVQGINKKNNLLIIKTPLGQVIQINIDFVSTIKDNRIIINY